MAKKKTKDIACLFPGALSFNTRSIAIFLIGFTLLAASPIFAQQPIKFGLHQNKPLNFRDKDQQIKGLVIDVFTHIAEQENWEIEYVPCVWGDCLDKLENGDIDVLSAIGYTPKRNDIYDFTSNPLITNWGLVVVQPGTTIQSILDLDGKTIGVMKRAGHTVTFQKLLDDFNINVKYLVVDDFLSVFRLVHEKKVDAGVVNRLITSQYIQDYNILKSPIVFNPIEIRYAFTKNSHNEVLQVVNRHLGKLKTSEDSIYFQAIDRWFGDKQSGATLVRLYWLGAIVLIIICFLIILNAALNYKVKQKTRLLKEEIANATALVIQAAMAEEKLRENKNFLEKIFENIPDMIFLKDAKTLQFVRLNKAGEELLGYTKGEFIGKNDYDFFPEEEADFFTSHDRSVLNSVDLKDIPEELIQTKYKGERILHTKKIPIYDKEGIPTYLLGISEDITERKLALDEVKTLRGLIPICSQCKKIRDDKGYWNILESYIQKHSDASFSHGMCPECSNELYGNENWYIEMKKDKKSK